MPEDKDKLIADHLASLPLYVRDAVKAANPVEKIRKMVTDFRLHLDEGERLEQEILLVMLGLSSPDTFIDETSKSFGLSDEDSTKLVDRVIAELFVPIREAMQKYMEERAVKAAPQSAPAQTLQEKLSGTLVPEIEPTPIAEALPKIERSPISEQKPITLASAVPPPAAQPTSPTITPAPAAEKPSLADIDKALFKPQASSSEKIDVGIAPAKPTYKVDPYLEPPV